MPRWRPLASLGHMTKLRPALLLAAAALSGLVAAGCQATSNNGSPNANTSSASDVQAKQALTAAAAKLLTTSSKFTLSTGDAPAGTNVTGALDPSAKKGNFTVAASGVTVQFRLLPDAMYLNLGGGLPGLPAGWLKLDANKVPANLKNSVLAGTITGADKMIGAIEEVRSTGTNAYAGTLDVSKAAGGLGLPQSAINQIPEADRKVPFTATLDAQGNLSEIVTTTKSNGKETKTTIKYSDFGAPVDVQTPPAGEVTDAPDLIYTVLGQFA